MQLIATDLIQVRFNSDQISSQVCATNSNLHAHKQRGCAVCLPFLVACLFYVSRPLPQSFANIRKTISRVKSRIEMYVQFNDVLRPFFGFIGHTC